MSYDDLLADLRAAGRVPRGVVTQTLAPGLTSSLPFFAIDRPRGGLAAATTCAVLVPYLGALVWINQARAAVTETVASPMRRAAVPS
jgi:hypothetical protein